ncbi:CBS domain-containing protein [uncultured Enterovirga sp.]|uniref:CBS domain-containing protein n=1 Tax=uncultured Enterovirga sp. TaxID=2026352 RepID=UPI0035CA4A6C
MKVEDIMRRKGTRIIMIRMNESVEMAARLLRRENVGALVVKDVVRTEGNTPVGMFSERDVLRAIADHGAAALAMPVSKLMSKNIISCRCGDDLDQVFELMDTHHIRHVPVMEPHGVIGVISIRDILPFRREGMATQDGAGASAGITGAVA